MTSDDERREVARRLRNMSYDDTKESLICAYLDALGIKGYADWVEIAHRLADLIEPEKRKCVRCGKEYEPTNPDQKYCSKQCKRMHHVERRLAEDDLPYWMAQVHGLCGNDEGGTIGCDRFDRPHRRNVVEVEPDGFCAWGMARKRGDRK